MKIENVVLVGASAFALGNAGAALSDSGTGLIYDDVLKITWWQHATYAKKGGYDSDGRTHWAAGWDDYKSHTLAAVVAEQPHDPAADYKITIGDFPYLVKLKFLNERRPTSPQKQRVIEQWVRSLQHLDTSVQFLYEEEFAFEEAGKTYWLPVQRPLPPHLAKELKSGDSVELYVVWIGSTKSEWVFLVNEFKK